MSQDLKLISSQFNIQGEIAAVDQLGEGFINDTFIVKTVGNNNPDYLLQRKNSAIFKDVPSLR